MSKILYSYKDCLTYFLNLSRKHYEKKFFLNRQEDLHHDLIALCEISPAIFWTSLYEQKIDHFKYKRLCKKIRSYLVRGEQIPYINQNCSFFGIPIRIEKGVFIPQPDTELLVSTVLFLSREIWPSTKKNRILEIGCGSGNIVIALASKRPSWDLLAVDINKRALSLARRNASELNIRNIRFLFSNEFSRVDGKFHIIVSNPPYISLSEYNLLGAFAKRQPREALLSDDNGYFFYEVIMKKISFFLMKKFLVAFEIGYSQRERIVKIILRYFPCAKVETFKDFNGNTRVVAFYQQ